MEDETLTLIKRALDERYDRVYYGTAVDHPKDEPWNYVVFSREMTSFAANLSGTSEVYIVAVVREGYVPTGTLEEVVEAMSAIPGMKPLASADAEYDYDVKPNTRSTVEMMTVRFVKGRKR